MAILWYPLVYGRTYEVDYRYLALPNDEKLDQAWLDAHIDSLLGMPDLLSDTPRWAAFQNDTHCVCGVACMVRDLGAEEAITLDRKKRRLYLFAAYVTQSIDPGASKPLPTPVDFQPFAPLLRYVRDHWETRDTQERYPPTLTECTEMSFSSLPELPGEKFTHHVDWFNTRSDTCNVWLDSERDLLWALASGAKQPISVALGLWGRREAWESPFCNVTLTNAQDREQLSRNLPDEEVSIDRLLEQLHPLFYEAYQLGDDLLPYDLQRWLETEALRRHGVKPEMLQKAQQYLGKDWHSRWQRKTYRRDYGYGRQAERIPVLGGTARKLIHWCADRAHHKMDESIRKNIQQVVDANYREAQKQRTENASSKVIMIHQDLDRLAQTLNDMKTDTEGTRASNIATDTSITSPERARALKNSDGTRSPAPAEESSEPAEPPAEQSTDIPAGTPTRPKRRWRGTTNE